jgi:photosystem II stability/assembly factor-like uncharacterized protein
MNSPIQLRSILLVVISACTITLVISVSDRMPNVGKLYGSDWANLPTTSEGPSIRTIAADPLNPLRLLIGTPKGIFMSTDGGKVWENSLDLSTSKYSISPQLSILAKSAIDKLKTSGEVDVVSGATALAIDPANPQKVIAGAVDGLYISSDGGKNWTKAESGAIGGGNFVALSIAIDPSNPDVIYSGTLANKLLKSRDSGTTWLRLELVEEERTVTTVAVHPFDTNVVYIGTPDAVMESKDGGTTWKRTLTEARGAVQSLSIDQVDPQNIYMGTSNGLYKSVDSGSSWMEVGAEAFGGKGIKEVAIAPTNSNTVYAATAAGVYGSADGGVTWQDLSKNANVKGVNALAFDPLNSKVIWAATAGGLFKTAAAKAAEPAPGATVTQEVAMTAETPTGEAPAKETPAEEVSAEGAPAEEVKPEETAPGEEVVETLALDTVPVAKGEGEGAAAEGPPVPTIDDVKTVLGQFNNEPTVQEIQEVAMRFAEVHPDLIEGWRKGAKWRGLVPEFRLRLDFDDEDQSQSTYRYETDARNRHEFGTYVGDSVVITPNTGTDVITTSEFTDRFYFQTDVLNRTDHRERHDLDWNWEFRGIWDLGDFLYSREQIRISDEVRDLVELRNDVLEEVTQFYFQRRQLQIDMLLSPPEDLRERLRMELQLQEVTANVDYLTGGYLTQRINAAKDGIVEKSSFMKRVFNL